MPRYNSKTYGKKGAQLEPSKASRQFDELLIETRTTRRGTIRLSPSPSPTKVSQTKNTPTKQPVKASVSPGLYSGRTTRRTMSDMSMEGFDSPKRRRIASGSEDPFSFSSDDETSKSPRRTSISRNNANNECDHLVIPSSPKANDTMRQTRGSIAIWEAENKIQTRSSGSPLSPGGLQSSTSPKKQGSNIRHAKRAIFNSAESESENVTKVNSALKESDLKVQRTTRYDTGTKSGNQNVSNSRSKTPEHKPGPSSPHSSLPNSPPGSPTTRSRASRTNSLQVTISKTQNRCENNRQQNVVNSSTAKPVASTLQTSVAKLALQPATDTLLKLATLPSAMPVKTDPAKPSSLTKDEFDFTDSEDEDASPADEVNKMDEANAIPKRIFNSPKKSPAKPKYNARSWNTPTQSMEELANSDSNTGKANSNQQHSVNKNLRPSDKQKAASTGITRSVKYPTKLNHSYVTSLKCDKQEKPLYTVVRHVKQAHHCQESGESQQFVDDIEYLLDGLKDTTSVSTRCLSTISLVEKCAAPPFRMHLRAHGIISKLFGALKDAAKDTSLALCTAGLMFMLSRDRLNMDLDRDSLNLMVQLLSSDPHKTTDELMHQEYTRNHEKLKRVMVNLPKTSPLAKDLDLDNISSAYLAMESLLSLTSRRAGEWFKEELRMVGGLDHIAQAVIRLNVQLSTVEEDSISSRTLELVRQLNGCLRVLENVTFMNVENQQYLLELGECSLVRALSNVLKVCEQLMEANSVDLEQGSSRGSSHRRKGPGATVRQCMLSLLRVLLNITHDNEWGSMKVGEQMGVMSTILRCVLFGPQYLPREQRFDLLVLSLGVLINLVEHSPGNAKVLVQTRTKCSYDSQQSEEDSIDIDVEVIGLAALTQLFLQRYRAAVKAEMAGSDEEGSDDEDFEAHTGLEWVEGVTVETEGSGTADGLTEEEIKKSVRKALHTAGKHMEDSIVASYTALLIGCLLRNNHMNVTSVRGYLPEGDFTCMVDMLKKFLSFIELTNAAGNSGSKSISKIIEVLETL